jgi:predicted aldo/keto reductase-like oxidoreductase
MERRNFGKNGDKLSVIGFGAIVVMNEEQSVADRFVAEAIDAGIDYFDVAPSYGNAQDQLGPALQPYRNGVFLACKTEQRDGPAARTALEAALKVMRTDHFDLYQFHAVSTDEDVDRVLAPGGALEVFVKAKEEGLVRHLGFSAHSEKAAVRLFEAFPFDSVLFPVNFASLLQGTFGPRIFEAAARRGASCLALKAVARAMWPEGSERDYPKCWYEPLKDDRLAGLALRYALSQPITAALPPGDIRAFRKAVLAVKDGVKPLDASELAELQALSAQVKPIFPLD